MLRRVPDRVSEEFAPRRVALFPPDRIDLRELAFGGADVDRRRLGIVDVGVVNRIGPSTL
ncbi:hypothetical protein ACFPM1_00145 [Halorubrum rubrum]|uniref:Uncharacterized protein n=1 Tax=Halorubrum rubrum TaxID=1126240 RepID=A0ABD5QWW6_9EURY|nr:hypothetical protein [Halorubrum rubrum]